MRFGEWQFRSKGKRKKCVHKIKKSANIYIIYIIECRLNDEEYKKFRKMCRNVQFKPPRMVKDLALYIWNWMKVIGRFSHPSYNYS